MRSTARWWAVAATLALAVTPAATASAGTAPSPTKADAKASAKAFAKDRNVPVPAPSAVTEGKLPVKGAKTTQARAAAAAADPAAAADSVGETRYWLALNDTTGRYYAKKFRLMGDGQHIQIWVAVDDNGNQALTFPAGSTGECRNSVFSNGEVTITQDQVNSFIHEFDTNMYPKESEAFSSLTPRDGSHAILGGARDENGNLIQFPAGSFAGPGDKVVTLVDNVRDANYYDPSTPDGQTYIAGFFSPTYAAYLDRNIMTIDSFDWLHRTGATPPDDRPNATGCAYAGVTPRPHSYEGTFAHEYQHLLENDQDTDEVSWVNEGLSDWAQTLVGYVDPNNLPTTDAADRHIACFQGYLGDNFGGPENSLTMWGDQGGPEILCDYGAAYSFMEYLHGRFGGDGFMSALHTEQGNGLEGLQNVLDAKGYNVDAQKVLHQWQAMMALDYQLDSGARLKGGSKNDYTSPTLKSIINFASPQAYESPGAPVNGADYVQLEDRRGTLSAHVLRSLSFQGAGSYAPEPLQWTVDDTSDANGGPALYGGDGDEIDNAAVTQVTVPTSNPTLTFDTKYDTEEGWDFFFVQVSTDGGKTYTSLPIDGTTSDHDPSAYPTVQSNVPGFTGSSGGWVTKTADLSAYAGKSIQLSFRYITDWGTTGAGVWIDNVKVGDTTITDGASADAFKSATQVYPVPVAGWTVQLVAYGNGKQAYVGSMRVRYNSRRNVWTGSLDRDAVESLIGDSNRTTTVAALVTADDPTESARSYPTYTLTANGVTQPGGS